ncbi:MAG: ribonuclease J [Desulfovibrio sp.]|jgi:ribonuclease J|nr:ribonuclease J [Desulfovibrio sp.]
MEDVSIFGLSPRIQTGKRAWPGAWLTIVPLGGFGQIGMNCMVWNTPGAKVVIDCGLMFPSDYHLGVDVIIPRFDFILENRDDIRGIILTHGHEDHIGALPWLVPRLSAPIYASPFTLKLVEHKLRERGLLEGAELVPVGPESPLTLGDMTFHFFPVCHSIIEGYALGAETPAGRVVHTGDFKIDPDPLDGPGTNLAALRAFAGKEGARLLLSDSTNIEHEGRSLSERQVLANLRSLFAKARGRIIVTLFSSHIQRIQEVFDCADESGRSVIVGGRSLVNNISMAQELNHLRPPKNLHLDADAIPALNDDKVALLVTGSQGEPLSALSRIAAGGHKNLSIHEGDMVIMSSRLIPGNTLAVNTLVNNLYRLGAEVHYDQEHPVHASGHAQQKELTEMIRAVRPRCFVPLHGEYRHLVKHARLAQKCGVEELNIAVIENGRPFTVTPGGISMEEGIHAESIMVDGKGVGDVGQMLLRERHILGGEGMVVVVLVLEEETRAILHGPEIFSRGFIFENQYDHILEEAKGLVLEELEQRESAGPEKLQEGIRLSLRRFFRKILDRDPLVLAIVASV